jgi:hypothetical protein
MIGRSKRPYNGACYNAGLRAQTREKRKKLSAFCQRVENVLWFGLRLWPSCVFRHLRARLSRAAAAKVR